MNCYNFSHRIIGCPLYLNRNLLQLFQRIQYSQFKFVTSSKMFTGEIVLHWSKHMGIAESHGSKSGLYSGRGWIPIWISVAAFLFCELNGIWHYRAAVWCHHLICHVNDLWLRFSNSAVFSNIRRLFMSSLNSVYATLSQS